MPATWSCQDFSSDSPEAPERNWAVQKHPPVCSHSVTRRPWSAGTISLFTMSPRTRQRVRQEKQKWQDEEANGVQKRGAIMRQKHQRPMNDRKKHSDAISKSQNPSPDDTNPGQLQAVLRRLPTPYPVMPKALVSQG